MSGTIKPPIATSWMYMADSKKDYDTIPPDWSEVNFKDVDVLNIGPVGIQADGTFGLYNTPETGNLATRFNWIIETARGQNSNIKIIVSQWWGKGDGIWGKPLSTLGDDAAAISKYTDSVIAFVQSYLEVSGGLDGYDIDYESNNVFSGIPAIVSQIRSGLNDLSSANGRPFYLTVSPDETTHLDSVVDSIDLVNMQTYEAGKYLRIDNFTGLGFTTQQLLFGFCPESECNTWPIDYVKSEYTDNNLAGVHLWRLNSGNYVDEGKAQAEIYSFLHPK